MTPQIASEFLGHQIAVSYTMSDGPRLFIDGNLIDSGRELSNKIVTLRGGVVEDGRTHIIEAQLSGWWSGNLMLLVDGEEIARCKP